MNREHTDSDRPTALPTPDPELEEFEAAISSRGGDDWKARIERLARLLQKEES